MIKLRKDIVVKNPLHVLFMRFLSHILYDKNTQPQKKTVTRQILKYNPENPTLKLYKIVSVTI